MKDIYEYKKHSIRTFLGIEFNYLDLDPDTIDIRDIAKVLSRVPRWMGHSNRFYSVAQHVCWCYDNTNGGKMEALMHDATEAYMSDIPSPLKSLLVTYKELEYRLNTVIAKKFDYVFPFSVQLKEVDKAALEYEWDMLRIGETKGFKDSYYKFLRFFNLGPYWSSSRARREFLKRFNKHIIVI